MFVKLSFYVDLTKMSKSYIVLCYIGFLVSLEGGKRYEFRLCIWNAKLSRPSFLPLEKNLILIAALEGRLTFRDNSLPPKEDPSFFQGLSLPLLKRREPRDRGDPSNR